MADPKSGQESGVVPAYGEGDTEAKSMTEAAKGQHKETDPAAKAKVPPPDVALPAAGTTETDLAANIEQKAEREVTKP